MSFPTVILPGYLASSEPYREMEHGLRAQGISAVTVPLRRSDWVPTIGGRSMVPILEKLHATVEQAQAEFNSNVVNLVGHSAGGWIARIYLGELPYNIHAKDAERRCCWAAHANVATLVTLGTPHRSQERWTKRNLSFVNDNYPGAFCSKVRYICVAGKAIYGDRRLPTWFAYSSYELTCGKGNTWGDGITPIEAAHLEGAENLVLDGVIHSPRRDRLWYGSPQILKTWAAYLA